jgi:hypothetical protein
MGGGNNATQNTAALIYFCTVINYLFKPFQTQFTYNFLNRFYPQLFSNKESYRKIVIINNYCRNCNRIINSYYNVLQNGFISQKDRVMEFQVPYVLTMIIDVLKDNNPMGPLTI